MNTKYINEWLLNVKNRTYLSLGETVEVEGVCKRSLGGRLEYAKIRILAEPAEVFSISSILEQDLFDFLQQDECINEAVFGILDVLATTESYPLFGVKIQFIQVDYDPIDSSRNAFRLAGRDAARHLIKTTQKRRTPQLKQQKK